MGTQHTADNTRAESSLEMNKIMKLVLLTAIAMTVASTSENSIVEEVFLGDDHAPTTDQDPGRPKITTMALQPPKAAVDATPHEAAFDEVSNNQDSDDADNAIIPEASSPAGKQGEAAASISKDSIGSFVPNGLLLSLADSINDFDNFDPSTEELDDEFEFVESQNLKVKGNETGGGDGGDLMGNVTLPDGSKVLVIITGKELLAGRKPRAKGEKCIDNDAKVNKDTKGWMKNCAYAVAEIGCVNRSVIPQINQTYADYFEGACCNSCKQKFERDNIPPKVPSLNFTYHQSDESYNLTKLNNTGWFAKKEKKIKAKEAEEAQRKSKENAKKKKEKAEKELTTKEKNKKEATKKKKEKADKSEKQEKELTTKEKNKKEATTKKKEKADKSEKQEKVLATKEKNKKEATKKKKEKADKSEKQEKELATKAKKQ